MFWKVNFKKNSLKEYFPFFYGYPPFLLSLSHLLFLGKNSKWIFFLWLNYIIIHIHIHTHIYMNNTISMYLGVRERQLIRISNNRNEFANVLNFGTWFFIILHDFKSPNPKGCLKSNKIEDEIMAASLRDPSRNVRSILLSVWLPLLSFWVAFPFFLSPI